MIPWEHPKYQSMTGKQQAFTRAYLARVDGNASSAWRAAGLPGKAVSVCAAQMLTRLRERIDLLRPLYDKWIAEVPPDMLVDPEGADEGAGPGAGAVEVAKIINGSLTRAGLAEILSSLAQAKDFRATRPGDDGYMPLQIRASDVIAASKTLMELKGWSKATRVQIEGNSKKPLTMQHRLAQRSPAEIEQEIAELQARNPEMNPALPNVIDVQTLIGISSNQ